MPNNPSTHPTPPVSGSYGIPTNNTPESDYLGEVVQMMSTELDQTIAERRQRGIIGWVVAVVTIILPLCLLGFFWWFVVCRASGSNFPEMWTFVTFMFSGTYVAVVALYFALIQGMFQKHDKKDNEFRLGQFKNIKSLLETVIKNNSGS